MMVRLKVDPVTISRRGSADLAAHLAALFANYPQTAIDKSCITTKKLSIAQAI